MLGQTHPEYVSEVFAACRQYDLVSPDPLPLARKRHVHEVAVQLEVSECLNDVALVVVPLQAVVIARHVGRRQKNFVFSFTIILSSNLLVLCCLFLCVCVCL